MQPCIFAMVSEENHYLPPARNGVEFTIVDTCSGMSCFNRLRMYDDSIDWSRTGNLRTGLQGRTLKVQGVGVSGVVNDIHFCENGENVMAMSTQDGPCMWKLHRPGFITKQLTHSYVWSKFVVDTVLSKETLTNCCGNVLGKSKTEPMWGRSSMVKKYHF